MRGSEPPSAAKWYIWYDVCSSLQLFSAMEGEGCTFEWNDQTASGVFNGPYLPRQLESLARDKKDFVGLFVWSLLFLSVSVLQLPPSSFLLA